ncbi:MAG: (d)CMP kinase [Candidatus Omnitrophota bacterium]
MIIAIDGPAGAGKSTVAKRVAQRLNFTYLDTGAMYRAVTVFALEKKADLHNEDELAALARQAKIEIEPQPDGHLKIILNGRDVTSCIRENEITKNVSFIAKAPKVRAVMVELQRAFGRSHDIVVEGRDIGTVVFPDAQKKFYLDADFKERARRRIAELSETNSDISAPEVAQDLQRRDQLDMTRSVGPLKQAEDAIYIDTTQMSIEEVVETILKHIKQDG